MVEGLGLPEPMLETQASGVRAHPPAPPLAPPGTGALPPGGRGQDEIPLEYLAIVLCGNDPRGIWRCLRPLDPPHNVHDGRIWFRRSVIVPWIREHQAEIRAEVRRLLRSSRGLASEEAGPES